jgi:imidazolonepropionase-like amidohydrolase
MVRYGAPATKAIEAATTAARAYLRLENFEPGAPADLVTFDRDPRRDIDALARPVAVLIGGRRSS